MTYIAVNTKIKAKRARLLTAGDYSRLVAEAGGFAASPYPARFREECAALLHFFQKPQRDFLRRFSNELPHTWKLLPHISVLDKPGRESLKRVFGLDADLRNILFVYRLKKYHEIHGNEVFAHLIPHRFRLTENEMSRLAGASSMENFAQLVSKSFYGKIFSSLSDFTRGEQNLSRAVRAGFKKEYRHENLASACGFLYEKHNETRNLRAVSLGIKNGLSPEEITGLLY